MSFKATARYIRISPYKVRPIVDAIRGKGVKYALDWLATYPAKRAVPVRKVIKSAADNAKSLQSIEAVDLYIKEVRIDQGPIIRYFKPGAMGRSNPYRKRLSHMSVIVEPVHKKEV
jgi:large subunit ribosomal protein L22